MIKGKSYLLGGIRPEQAAMERLYRRFSRRNYVHPDPLEFLYRYPDERDRETVGLIASSLAYGRVTGILKSVEDVLSRIPGNPGNFIPGASDRSLDSAFTGFRHRFTAGTDMAMFAKGIKRAIGRHGSLNACFLACLKPADLTVAPALRLFVEQLGGEISSLLPLPDRGSACKRLNLYLRWMIRKDRVDPGGWRGISPSKLIVPLDTHMARIGRSLGFTRRNSPDMAMAMEITNSLRAFDPDDPVKYDFALTRFGINPAFDPESLDASLSQ